ncbi:ABC transporter substrate-binding protein [Paenibacillus athensensis]|uniref:Cobalamin-binding protein n=1 Tax=Paenibacillus athensensis TaxID=1967502 RepID=A0A4Y8PUF6_9BACL|nr:ABC transporter substrate-binding protein [Paenibacillus athensensis]
MASNKWMRVGLLGLTLAAALSLAACGAKNDQLGEIVDPAQLSSQGTSAAKGTPQPTRVPETHKTNYPMKIKDATGMEFTFDKAPQRIVSVSPAETEALFALGLDDRIVGVADYDDYPEAVQSKPKMGSIVKPNQEALLAANADLIVTGVSMSDETVQKLRELKLNVFKVEPKTLDDAIADVVTFGIITDRQGDADRIVGQMNDDRQKVLNAVKDLTPEQRQKVYIEFSPGWTVGSGEFMSELIGLAGGINVAADGKGWYQISEEKIIQQNPAVIFYAKGVIDDKSNKPLEQIIRERSGWEQIDAVKNNRIIGIDQNLLSRPGPRLTQGLLEIAKGIYPDRVK